MDLIMGIDIGSTNTKAVAFDFHGNVHAAGHAQTVLSHDADHDGWTYWDPDTIWNGVKVAICQVVSQLQPGKHIRALACSCFSGDFVPLGENGLPVYPFKSWHCTRTLPQMKKWLETHDANELLFRHGRQTESLVSLFMMRWMRENIPQIADQTKMMLQVSDYVNYKLTGKTVSDYTQSATTGAFDPIECKWNESYLEWAGFSTKELPEVWPAGTIIGKVTAQASLETGLDQNTLVVLGAHDNECGCFSLGMKNDSVAYNVCGTWDMVMAMHRTANFDQAHADNEMAVLRYLLPDSWISVRFGLGANYLEWGKDNFYGTEIESARKRGLSIWDVILEQTAKIPPLSNGILALPFRVGTTGRERHQFASGTIMGIDNCLGKAHVMHALFESLGYQTLDYLKAVETVCGKDYDHIVSVGGPTRNRQLMQIKADICGRPVHVSAVSEGTALGAAMLAGIGTGYYSDAFEAIDAVSLHNTACIYDPNPQNAQRYAEGYQKYALATRLLEEIENYK